MLRYAALRTEGTATEAERCKMLEQHRQHVSAQMAELEACLIVLDAKISGYTTKNKKGKRL